MKVSLKNITENHDEIFDTYAIKNKNNIKYINQNIIHKITIEKDKIVLIRESEQFIHKQLFEVSKKYKSEYYIKNLSASIYFTIKTISINQTNNKIEIEYDNIDNNNKYLYILEMSEK